MGKLIELYKQILQELQNEKKLARKLNQKNVGVGERSDINHGPQKNNSI